MGVRNKIVYRNELLSDCNLYRYTMERYWKVEEPYVLFIGLSPEEGEDSPTNQKYIRFARRWKFGGIVVVNLYAWRNADWRPLYTLKDPVGDRNDVCILRMAMHARLVIAAWGVKKIWMKKRVKKVEEMILGKKIPMWSVGMTKDGYPRNPLLVSLKAKPVLYRSPK